MKEEVRTYRRTTLGAGLVFMRDIDLWRQFTGIGLTLNGFRAWLRCMGVPVILVGKVRLVRVQSLKLALLAITKIGEKDFAVPGCQMIRISNWKVRQKYARRVDPELYKRDMKFFLAELLYSKATAGHRVTYETAKLASEAAMKLLWVAMKTLPARTQLEYDANNVRTMEAMTKNLEPEALAAIGWKGDEDE